MNNFMFLSCFTLIHNPDHFSCALKYTCIGLCAEFSEIKRFLVTVQFFYIFSFSNLHVFHMCYKLQLIQHKTQVCILLTVRCLADHSASFRFRPSKTTTVSTESSVSQKNHPLWPAVFLHFFHKRLRILNQFLHTYYTFLSTRDDKFLFNHLQL